MPQASRASAARRSAASRIAVRLARSGLPNGLIPLITEQAACQLPRSRLRIGEGGTVVILSVP